MTVALAPDEVVTLNRLAIVARVLAGTAHDVNNALQIIDGSAEMLEQQEKGSDSSGRALQRIRGQCARAASVVSEVTRFLRTGEVKPGQVRLRDVIARSVTMRTYPMRRAGIALEYDADALPAAAVSGHALQLQQVVLNLMINAEQALVRQPGGRITIDVVEEDGSAVLNVRDNGPGLPADLGGRAFDLFVTTHPVPDTTGLGLTAARIIARAHGGDVTLADQLPGCCATLRLPLARA